jgi:molybdate transport system regulatory protein
MVQVTLKLTFDRKAALGPGKVKLLEAIAETGSISAAGRTMGMSYRRAWTLVADLNGSFVEPLVTTQLGGSGGGGAALTRLGKDVVKRYRSIEARVRTASRAHLQMLEGATAAGATAAGRAAGGPSRR